MTAMTNFFKKDEHYGNESLERDINKILRMKCQ